MLSPLGRIVISDIFVANLFIFSLSGMILSALFYTKGAFALNQMRVNELQPRKVRLTRAHPKSATTVSLYKQQ